MSSIKSPEFCSIEGYLDKLSHQPEKSDVKMERPLRDKILEYLWDGQVTNLFIISNS